MTEDIHKCTWDFLFYLEILSEGFFKYFISILKLPHPIYVYPPNLTITENNSWNVWTLFRVFFNAFELFWNLLKLATSRSLKSRPFLFLDLTGWFSISKSSWCKTSFVFNYRPWWILRVVAQVVEEYHDSVRRLCRESIFNSDSLSI